MKRFMLSVICLLSLHAQSQISPFYSGAIGRFYPPSLIRLDDGSYTGFKTLVADTKGKSWNTFRKMITFVRYDKDLNPMMEAKLTSSGGICNGEYYELKKAGNKLWFIYLEPGNDNDMGSIRAVEIDPVNLQQKEMKTLAAANELDQSLHDSRYTMYFDFLCGASPAGKYIYLCLQLSEKNNYLACFDENMKQLWSGKNKRPEGEITSAELDDDGYLYMGIKSRKGDLSAAVFSPAGQMSSAGVSIPAGKVKELVFHPVKGAEPVVVTGTYKESDNCTGVYKGIINRKGEINNAVTTVFPNTIVASMDKEGFASTKEKKFGMFPLFCAAAVRNNEGNSTMSMIMEFKKDVIHGTTGLPLNTLGGSLIYVDFSGAAPVFTRVPKYSIGNVNFHYAFNGHYFIGCMYYASPADTKLVLLYYDNPINLDRDPLLDAKAVNPKNQVMVAAVISKDGTFKRQLVTATPLEMNKFPPVPGAAIVPILTGEGQISIVTVKL